MTEEQIKAAISSHVVQLLANRAGFKCSEPGPDHGCDLSVTRATKFERDGRTRFLDSGQYLDLQLKCTTERSVVRTGAAVRYPLEAKAYNDLIDRRDSGALVPLILVLFVLPDDDTNWISVNLEALTVRRGAYWFLPEPGARRTENERTITIEIPDSQAVGLSFVSDRFHEVYP